eukprot:superscaffoldBa00000481_g5066
MDLQRIKANKHQPSQTEGINFQREGVKAPGATTAKNPPSILHWASDLEMQVDLNNQLVSPQEVAVTSLRPDMVLLSRSTKTILVAELTVHREEGQASHFSPTEKSQVTGKPVFLLALLERLRQEGHRTLIFALYRKVLDIMERILGNRGFKVIRLNGTITQIAEKEKHITLFQTDQHYSVFLLTTQAKYQDLNDETLVNGWHTAMFPMEVGCCGFTATSMHYFLQKIGLEPKQLRKPLGRLQQKLKPAQEVVADESP